MPVGGTGSAPMYTGTLDCFKQTIARDGFRVGFFWGFELFYFACISINLNSIIFRDSTKEWRRRWPESVRCLQFSLADVLLDGGCNKRIRVTN